MPNAQEFDPSQLSQEDLDAGLETFREEDSAIDEAPESEPVEKTDTSESDTAEASQDEEQVSQTETTDETASEETPGKDSEQQSEEEKKLFANKFHTTEDLEAGYKNVTQKFTQTSQELAEAKRQLEELKKIQPQKEAHQEEVEGDKPAELYDNKFFDEDKYEEIRYEQGEGAAMNYALQQFAQAQQSQAEQAQVSVAMQQAQDHNDAIHRDRARELLYEKSKQIGNRELMDKYNDPNYVVSKEDLEAMPTVLEQFLAEGEYVQNNFQQEPVKVGEKIVAGRLPKDVYKRAYIILNHEKLLEKNKIETAENTVKQMQDATSGAKVLTPEGKGTPGSGVKFSQDDDADTVSRKSRNLSDEELEAALIDSAS